MSFMRSQYRLMISSWKGQSPSIRLIRLWLGLTWIYGGWDKASDPNFLASTGSTSILRQLQGYSISSPLGFLFERLIEYSTLVGIFVMAAEFTIGIATIAWVAPTFAALSGFGMSMGLWLAASWHVKPYFLGSDTAYAILWLAYFLALVGKRRKIDVSLDRRGTMRLGAVALLAIGVSALGRVFQKSRSLSSANSATLGLRIVESSRVAVGANYEFTTQAGEPAILFKTKNGVFAYSKICTHQGCTVLYSPPEQALVCPCHGSAFDPFNGAAVTVGPALNPLGSVKVAEQSGWIVLA